MASEITPLIAGNWKMNGLQAQMNEFQALGDKLATLENRNALVAICPPATLLAAMSEKGAVSGIATGGQDCHASPNGAHTGDISALMLKDAGAAYVIVGHSERRADHAETDAQVRAKAQAGIAAGLVPIICVGETRAEREAGKADAIVAGQLEGSVPDMASEAEIVIAYEPVWAIGTGLTPTNADIAQMHAGIRRLLVERFGARGQTIRILYGGSLKPANAKEILAVENVNGGLVGGASLLANDFFAIISAA
ncbi:Triosephosphate isomerase [Devosia sp. H5989]|nr:Triosephosphate isomerase [Devosia sp. H5989]